MLTREAKYKLKFNIMSLLSFSSDMNIVSLIFIGPDLCLRRDSGSKIIKCDFLLLPLEIK